MMGTVSPKDRAGVIAPPPLIFALAYLCGYALHWFAPIDFILPDFFGLIGQVIIGLAIILALIGIAVMKGAKTNVDVYKPTTSIVTNGPFRFTRNPLYISLTLLYIGVAIKLGHLYAFLFLPLALLIMQNGVINREERYLEVKFSQEYLDYKNRVPRWLF